MEQPRPTPPTVREAMRSGGMQRALLVAGGKGLDRRIDWVRVMETPEIVARMGPHELLLTAAYAMRGDPAAPARLVAELAAIQSAGLVVTLGRYLDTLPRDMVTAADLHQLPLFTLAGDEVTRTELMEPLLERIMFAEHWRLKRSIEIHRRFTDLVVDGKGIVEICGTLAEIAGAPVTIEDATFHLLAHSGEPTDDPHRMETITGHGSPGAPSSTPGSSTRCARSTGAASPPWSRPCLTSACGANASSPPRWPAVRSSATSHCWAPSTRAARSWR